jgi:hypothetical protein
MWLPEARFPSFGDTLVDVLCHKFLDVFAVSLCSMIRVIQSFNEILECYLD